ncbi:MAG: radical SAM protein [Oscillibacter sp.]|nr:radical SAM protein [Oscillibacter sp.]
MGILRYSARIGQCAVLGPGERAVIWVHGCCFSCPGCIGERYRSGPAKETDSREMASWFLAQGTGELTISGGEPMLQAEALSEMLEQIRKERECGVIVYTGFVYETLLEKAERDTALKSFLNGIDLLIDGPYIRELDENQPYRGSGNQRLLTLSPRYEEALESYYAAPSRQVEIRLSTERTILAGVPSREQAEIWNKIKELGDRHDD